MLGNIIIVLLSLWNWWRRYDEAETAVLSGGLLLSAIVVLILL